MVAALLLCCACAWLRSKRTNSRKPAWLAWLPQTPSDGALRIKDVKKLTPRVSLHAIEWEGGNLLVAVGDHFCVRLDAPAAPARPDGHKEQA